MEGGPAGGERPAPSPAQLQQITAFVTEHVLTDRRITCVEAWDGALLAGCSDGTLLVVRRQPAISGSSSSTEEHADGGGAAAAAAAAMTAVAAGTDSAADGMGDGSPQPPAPPRWAVAQALRGFGQRRVLQLLAAPTRSMLLCLADDGLNAHELPTLRLKGQATRTRGAGAFAWDDDAGLLAVAVKRRLLLFKYDGLEFVPQVRERDSKTVW